MHVGEGGARSPRLHFEESLLWTCGMNRGTSTCRWPSLAPTLRTQVLREWRGKALSSRTLRTASRAANLLLHWAVPRRLSLPRGVPVTHPSPLRLHCCILLSPGQWQAPCGRSAHGVHFCHLCRCPSNAPGFLLYVVDSISLPLKKQSLCRVPRSPYWLHLGGSLSLTPAALPCTKPAPCFASPGHTVRWVLRPSVPRAPTVLSSA